MHVTLSNVSPDAAGVARLRVGLGHGHREEVVSIQHQNAGDWVRQADKRLGIPCSLLECSLDAFGHEL
jgi:hypothetical protein